MEKKFGGIELGELFGGYEIVGIPATSLPEDVASAVGAINGGLLGATYQPIFYVGRQVVNGVNHLFIAEEIRVTKNQKKMIVGLIINVPPGEGAGRGEGAKVVQIVEEADLPADVQIAFDTAVKHLVGVAYKPLAYIGKQVVKGVNYHVIAEARGIYPGAEPYAAVVTINVFEGNTSIVGIAPLANDNGLCGYAFTWLKAANAPLGEWP